MQADGQEIMVVRSGWLTLMASCYGRKHEGYQCRGLGVTSKPVASCTHLCCRNKNGKENRKLHNRTVYPASSGESTVACWGFVCRKKDGKGDKEVNKAWNKYAKYTTVGDGKALWKGAAEELAAYAAQVRPHCQYAKLFSRAVPSHSTCIGLVT